MLSCFVGCFPFWVFSVMVLFCILFLLLYIVVSFQFLYKFTDHYHLEQTQLHSITIISYQKAALWLEFIAPHFFRITPLRHILHPSVYKIQQISETDSHTIQTEGQAYNSVRVYLLITSVSLATSIGTPRITFCQREVTYSTLQNGGRVKRLKIKTINSSMIKRRWKSTWRSFATMT